MITDRQRYAAWDEEAAMRHVLEDVQRAAASGVDLIQVRERGISDRGLLAFTRRTLAAVKDSRARVLVNARTDIALAAPADGIHLPAASPAAPRVRAVTPPGFLVGRSVHDLDEAVAAEQQGGCDYLVFGTVYPSASKPAGHPVAGVDALARVCAAVGLPVLAIGGLGPERLPEVAAAGAAGVAAIGVFVTPPGREIGGTAADVASFVARVRELFGVETGRPSRG
jgi:thiamine-phosphate pyrophosphorylase